MRRLQLGWLVVLFGFTCLGAYSADHGTVGGRGIYSGQGSGSAYGPGPCSIRDAGSYAAPGFGNTFVPTNPGSPGQATPSNYEASSPPSTQPPPSTVPIDGGHRADGSPVEESPKSGSRAPSLSVKRPDDQLERPKGDVKSTEKADSSKSTPAADPVDLDKRMESLKTRVCESCHEGDPKSTDDMVKVFSGKVVMNTGMKKKLDSLTQTDRDLIKDWTDAHK